MALFGEIVAVNAAKITFRVASKKGDAQEFGIQGIHDIPLDECLQVRRRGAKGDTTEDFDELEVSAATLDRLGKCSFPL